MTPDGPPRPHQMSRGTQRDDSHRSRRSHTRSSHNTITKTSQSADGTNGWVHTNEAAAIDKGDTPTISSGKAVDTDPVIETGSGAEIVDGIGTEAETGRVTQAEIKNVGSRGAMSTKGSAGRSDSEMSRGEAPAVAPTCGIVEPTKEARQRKGRMQMRE